MKKPDPTLNHDSILTRLTEGRQALEETLTKYRRGDLDTMTARTLIYGSSTLLSWLEAERAATVPRWDDQDLTRGGAV